MKVSLSAFLRTGNLGDLRYGMSQEEVRALLGEPDATGNTSRRYPQPSIFLYGAVELNFCQRAPRDLISVWWEAGEKGAFRLTPACEVTDWVFTPAWTFDQVEDYLRGQEIPFDYRDPPPLSEELTLALPSGVTFCFQARYLYGIFAASSGDASKQLMKDR